MLQPQNTEKAIIASQILCLAQAGIYQKLMDVYGVATKTSSDTFFVSCAPTSSEHFSAEIDAKEIFIHADDCNIRSYFKDTLQEKLAYIISEPRFQTDISEDDEIFNWFTQHEAIVTYTDEFRLVPPASKTYKVKAKVMLHGRASPRASIPLE